MHRLSDMLMTDWQNKSEKAPFAPGLLGPDSTSVPGKRSSRQSAAALSNGWRREAPPAPEKWRPGAACTSATPCKAPPALRAFPGRSTLQREPCAATTRTARFPAFTQSSRPASRPLSAAPGPGSPGFGQPQHAFAGGPVDALTARKRARRAGVPGGRLPAAGRLRL